MSEMIDRVARAMCRQGGFEPDELMPNGGLRYKYYEPMAWAAIEAMREPTDKMMMAGENPDTGPYECQGIYHRMIDAALTTGDREDG